MSGPATTGNGSGGEPAATLRTQHAEATRRAVLDAARSLFGKKGYGQTSVDEIAAAARVTKGAVYHHFTGKEALFRVVHAEVIAEAIARATRAGDPAGPTIDRILAQVNTYLDAALGAEFRRIVLTDGPAVLGLEAENSAEQQAGTEAFRLFIAEAVAHGELADFDPSLLAALILGMTWVGGMLIAQAGDPGTARAKLGQAVDAMLRGLSPDSRP
jgi:AcrR family transcriptional regulator